MRLYIVPLLVLLIVAACSTYTGKSFVPLLPGYNEKSREVFVLKKKLLEVSGIVHLDKDSIAAINDEKGELFFLNLKDNSSQKFRFKGKDDYEDLVKTDSLFYVAESDGDILEITGPPNVQSVAYQFPETENKLEFESLVWYKKLNKLVLISKDQRNRMSGISGYSFDLGKKAFDTALFFNIPLRDIFNRLQNYAAECKPSGAALHPITNQLYIIASIGKLLLVCSPQGKLEKLYQLNPAQFPQPEGITFADNGDMYISNEGLDGKATILKFPYSAPK